MNSNLVFITIIKKNNPIDFSSSLESQLLLLSIPSTCKTQGRTGIENLKLLLKFGVGSYFDLLQNSNSIADFSDTAIENTKFKLDKILADIKSWEQTIQVPQLIDNLPFEFKEFLTKEYQGRTTLLDTDVSATLDVVIPSIQGWLKKTNDIIKLEHDPLDGNLTDEIDFWVIKETALQNIKDQLETDHVKNLIEVLQLYKKTHISVALSSCTGLKESLKDAEIHRDFLKALRSDSMLQSDDLNLLKAELLIMLTNFKKIKTKKFPTEKGITILKLIVLEFNRKLIELLSDYDLFSIEDDQFDFIYNFSTVDLNDIDMTIRGCINFLREKLRKEDNAFMPIKIESPLYIVEILSEVKFIRETNANIKSSIETLLKQSFLNSEEGISIYQDLFTDCQTAYKELVDMDRKFLLSVNLGAISAAKTKYLQKIQLIETKIASILNKAFLGCENNPKALFNMYAKFADILSKPHVRMLLQDFHGILLHSIEDELEQLEIQCNSQIEILSLLSLNNIAPFSSKLLWINQVLLSISKIISHLELALTSNWENYPEGKRFSAKITSLLSEIDVTRLLEKWIDDTSSRIKNSLLAQPLIIQKEKRKSASFNYTLSLDQVDLDITKEIKCLKILDLKIPRTITMFCEKIDKINKHIFLIKESLDLFYNSLDKINSLNNAKILVKTRIATIIGYVEALSNKKWNDLINEEELVSSDSTCNNNIVENVHRLRTEIFQMEEEVTLIFPILKKIPSLLHSLDSCEYSKADFLEVLATIQNYLISLDKINTLDLLEYVSLLNREIQDTLNQRYREELIQFGKDWHSCDVHFSENLETHNLVVRGFSFTLEPPLEFSKEKYVLALNYKSLMISQLPRLSHLKYKVTESDDYFSINMSEMSDIYGSSLGEMLVSFKKAEEFFDTWKLLENIWDVELMEIKNIHDNEIEKWLNIFSQLRKLRDIFDTIDTFKNFGMLRINFQQAQKRVYNQFDSCQRYIVDSFANNLKSTIKETYLSITEINRDLENLVFDLNSSEAVISLLSAMAISQNYLKANKELLQNLKKGNTILLGYRFTVDDDWIKFENVQSQVLSIENIIGINLKFLEKHSEIISSMLVSSVLELKKFYMTTKSKWEDQKPTGENSFKDALLVLHSFEVIFSKINEKYQHLLRACSFLSIPCHLDIVYEIQEIRHLKDIWTVVMKLYQSLEKIRTTRFDLVEVNCLKQMLEEDFLNSRNLPPEYKSFPAVEKARLELKEGTRALSFLDILKNSPLDETHWNDIFNKLSGKNCPDVLFVGDILNLDLENNKKYIHSVVNFAESENLLKKSIDAIENSWYKQKLEVSEFNSGISLISCWNKYFSKVNDDLNTLDSILVSPYSTKFLGRVKSLYERLLLLLEIIKLFTEAQKQWVYLVGIFKKEDEFERIIPLELSRFENVSHDFLILNDTALGSLTVIDMVDIPDITVTLKGIANSLVNIRKSLANYLEKQREQFSRFYFIGNDDLLELIGNSGDRDIVSRHIGKLFPGIGSLGYDSSGSQIISIHSCEGEIINLQKPVLTTNYAGLIDMLTNLDDALKRTLSENLYCLYKTLKSSFYIIDAELLRALMDTYCSQVLCLGFQLMWTQLINDALQINDFVDISQKLNDTLSLLVSLVPSDLNVLKRTKVENLIIDLIHKIKLIGKLSSSDFASQKFRWFCEIKFYICDNFDDPAHTVRINHANLTTFYGFEYHGCLKSLVPTELTGAAFNMLSESLNQNLGGLLLGPAGTGKTESVKALGHYFGRDVFVFCCDETFDVESVSRILIGISKIGAWVCFDEFNRLNGKILSGVSTQIEKIQNGISGTCSEIELFNKEVKVHKETGIFITNNPHYRGRSTLPDNLKSKFLTFSMMKPDSEVIAKNILLTQGFLDADNHTIFLVELFKDLDQYCSAQKHYEFGLRTLKSVIINSGKLLRSNLAKEMNELEIVGKSCCDVILPRLTSSDQKIVERTLSNYNISILGQKDNFFLNTLTEIAKNGGLSTLKQWVAKCHQLYEVSKLNHGVILVGPSGFGKTTAFNCVLDSLSQITGKKNITYRLDAKVLSKSSLFGYMNYTTMEWSDGILTSILRKVNGNTEADKSSIWIIFDGDIDPNWVENLNSVLDDNMFLTLSNGERLPLSSNIRFVFEVENLDYATPATISRCGIVLFDQTFDIYSILKNQMSIIKKETLEKEEKWNSNLILHNRTVEDFKDSMLNVVFEVLDEETLTCIWNMSLGFESILDFSELKVMQTFRSLIQSALTNLLFFLENNPILGRGDFTCYLQKKIILSILWSFGGQFCNSSLLKFIEALCSISKIQKIVGDVPLDELPYMDVELPNGTFKKERTSSFEMQPHMILNPNVIIPTLDTAVYKSLIYSFLQQHNPVILCGPPGSGKTMLLLQALRKSPLFELTSLNFSKETSIKSIIITLEQTCHYKSTANGMKLMPRRIGKWVVLFLDEINLPKLDKYGTQVVIHFVRQLIKENGFWHPSKKIWIDLQNIQIVAACNPSSTSGRQVMTKRLTTYCATLMIDYPPKRSLERIYHVYCTALLKTVPDLSAYSSSLSASMVEVYSKYKEQFIASRKAHYISSPRDLTRWVKGMYLSLKTNISANLADLIRLWANEGLRLFSDKLSEREEKGWVFNMIYEVAGRNFPHIDLKTVLKLPILYSDWLSIEYQSVEENKLRMFIKERFNVFNQEESNVGIVLYEALLDHALRIDRVLKNPQGHLVLVGPSGSGKTTLTKFVSWMNGIRAVQLNLPQSFTLADFENILKGLLLKCSVNDEKICFVIDESTVLDDAFLEIMNTLLANAEVPGLFEGEEFESLLEKCSKAAQKDGLLLDTSEEIYSWFVSKVSTNFHVVFTVSDLYDSNSKPFLLSSALLNRCVINWMGAWSDSALTEVAQEMTKILPLDHSDYKLQTKGSEVIGFRDVVIKTLVCIHNETQQITGVSLAPVQFVDLVKTFILVFVERENQLQTFHSHVIKGLDHLKETSLKVKQLRVLLVEKKKKLEEEEHNARSLLDKMIIDQNEAERKQDMSLKMQELFAEQEKTMLSKRQAVVDELKEVEFLIVEAQNGVLNIKKQHLTELRSMNNPPDTIKMILESICVMLGYKVSTWKDVQYAIRQDDFITSIISFNGEEQVTPELIRLMETKYLNKPTFNYESANRASKACGPLLIWVQAQLRYFSIVVKVKPLKKQLHRLESELVDTKAKLIAIDGMITDLKKEVEKYKFEYSEAIALKEKVKHEMLSVEEKLNRSIALLKNLTAERARWEKNIEEYEEQKSTLIGNVILMSCFMNYCGSCLPNVRTKLIQVWKSILSRYYIRYDSKGTCSEILDVANVDQIIEWQRMGLPNDEQFIGNTAILSTPFNQSYNFIIDPSNTFSKFLAQLIKPRKLLISSFLDQEFGKKLENCLKFGGSFLIKDGEHYDPIINRLISQDIKLMGSGRKVIQIGSKEIDMSPDFSLYILTNDPTYTPSAFIAARMKVLNYSYTPQSLKTEALNLTMLVREPDIENSRLELLRRGNDCKAKLRSLEDELLKIMSRNKENILDDDVLLTKLEATKEETINLEKQMLEIDKVMESYETKRSQFEKLADFYSDITQVIERMVALNKIYIYSNDYTRNILHKTLLQYGGVEVDKILKYFASVIFKETSTSLMSGDINIFTNVLKDLTGADCTSEVSFNESLINEQFIILRSSKGTDSSLRIEESSRHQNVKTLKYALGSNNGHKIATQMILDNVDSGHWIVLENIELSNEFLESLNETIVKIKENEKPSDVKIFLTCRIEADLPVLLLKSCKQIVLESDITLKKSIIDQILNDSSTLNLNTLNERRPKELKKIFLILVWFYSVILSRLRFESGFSRRYEINQNDLRNAEKFIYEVVKKNDNQINVAVLKIIEYFTVELIFGGKIDDAEDLNFLVNMGKKLFCGNFFEPNFNILRYTSVPGLKYNIPNGYNNLEYVEWIKGLPDNEPMEWLCLPSDAEDQDKALRILRGKEMERLLLQRQLV